MDRFLNIVKAHAAALDRAQGQPRFGLVASVDPQRYAVRVSLQPEGVLSGWLPVLSQWVGAGWGIACLPAVAVTDALATGRLKALKTPFLDLRRKLSLLLHRQKYRGALLDAFLDGTGFGG